MLPRHQSARRGGLNDRNPTLPRRTTVATCYTTPWEYVMQR